MPNEYEEEEVEETVEESTEETTEQEETKEVKPKRTPEQELEYFEGRAQRLRKDLGIETPAKETKSKKSNDLDYGEKAYLTANGIKGAKEFDFVKTHLKQSGKDLDSLLESNYFKEDLEKFRALSQTADATPTGKRSSGVATESVDYWVAKAGKNAENLAEVPQDMRQKVVNALEAKEKNTGQFYNS